MNSKQKNYLAGVTSLVAVLLLCPPEAQAKGEFSPSKQLEYCCLQVNKALDSLRLADGSYDFSVEPRNIPGGDNQGGWHCYPAGAPEWCSGFWPGILWMTYSLTGSQEVKTAAEGYTESLRRIAYQPILDHDIGFIIGCSFGKALSLGLAPDAVDYNNVVCAAADTLATLFNPIVGTTLSWPNMRAVKQWPHNTIIDNMMNMDIMFRAAANGGNRLLRDLAITHARTTMQNAFQEDGTVAHVSVYDTIDGHLMARVTHQGLADTSMWARGQAWAIYGYTMAYRWTGKPVFLNFARKVTDIYLHRLAQTSDDAVPLWDMDDPRGPGEAPRDASAAAIVASALLELSDYVGGVAADLYRQEAMRMLQCLSTPKYLSPQGSVACLCHSVGSLPADSEIDYSIIYADYYYMEALMRAVEAEKEGKLNLKNK